MEIGGEAKGCPFAAMFKKPGEKGGDDAVQNFNKMFGFEHGKIPKKKAP
jgi:hypothetical protein